MTAAKLRLAMASMGKRDTSVGALCEELGITRQTLYRFVALPHDDPKRQELLSPPSEAVRARSSALLVLLAREGRGAIKRCREALA